MRETFREYRAPDPSRHGGEFVAQKDNDPLKACMRFVEGMGSPADLDVIRAGFETYLNCGGTIPLEICLRIPRTHTKWRIKRRNLWLVKAAELIQADTSWACALLLEEKWNTFIRRGAWQAWRDDERPPEHATPLSEALFYATRLNRSEGLNAKQLSRIIGHLFRVKCR